MSIPQAIKLLLDVVNRPPNGGVFSAFSGSVGNMVVLQRDFNAATAHWRKTGNTNGLKQLAATLQAYGNLTNTEYEQIMKVLDGEQQDGTQHNQS